MNLETLDLATFYDNKMPPTTTASKPRKSRSQNQDLSERLARSWPFTRVDPKLLERAHRQATKPKIEEFEEAPF